MGRIIEARSSTLILIGVLLVAAGGAGGYLFTVNRAPVPAPTRNADASVPDDAIQSGSVRRPDVTVSLSAEAIQRAGLKFATVTATAAGVTLRVPGVIEANGYRTVSITALTSGRVTRVVAELGRRVRRGDVLAQIYSPALAEARTNYRAAGAELEAHEREVQRTEKLVAIGAASRQALERVHAEHAVALAAVERHRSELTLLGASAQELDATDAASTADPILYVVAPSDGTVTARAANVGMNVDPSLALFTVADLSTVWVVASLYERDLTGVSVGAPAGVTVVADPDATLAGKVTYIDPQVNVDTRAAQIRVEVPNRDQRLRLGMLADVQLEVRGPVRSRVALPRSAVQTVGSRSVVYLADPSDPSKFTEREVSLGPLSGDDEIQVESGVEPGDVVVTEGSFSLRAESERLGLSRQGAVLQNQGPPSQATLANQRA